MIRTRNLACRFGDLAAVDGLDLEVAPGEIFGFLGPNGAGKTTTISMLITLLAPTSGTAEVGGHDVVRAPQRVREAIGVVFQSPSLDDRFTARENMRLHAMLYGLSGRQARTRIEDLLRMVELQDRADERVRTFSGGMKRRLEIARGLLHRPRVLFLDEPTLGLDPQARRAVWGHVRALRDQHGVTVFLTTHYMDEAEVCDRIAIIDHGRLQALDTPHALKRSLAQPTLDDVFLRLTGHGLRDVSS